jgi:hypothetical protein
MESTTIAVDVAKEVLEVAVSVRPGQVSQQKRLSRTAFMKFCTDQPPATVLLKLVARLILHPGQSPVNGRGVITRTLLVVK